MPELLAYQQELSYRLPKIVVPAGKLEVKYVSLWGGNIKTKTQQDHCPGCRHIHRFRSLRWPK